MNYVLIAHHKELLVGMEILQGDFFSSLPEKVLVNQIIGPVSTSQQDYPDLLAERSVTLLLSSSFHICFNT